MLDCTTTLILLFETLRIFWLVQIWAGEEEKKKQVGLSIYDSTTHVFSCISIGCYFSVAILFLGKFNFILFSSDRVDTLQTKSLSFSWCFVINISIKLFKVLSMFLRNVMTITLNNMAFYNKIYALNPSEYPRNKNDLLQVLKSCLTLVITVLL